MASNVDACGWAHGDGSSRHDVARNDKPGPIRKCALLKEWLARAERTLGTATALIAISLQKTSLPIRSSRHKKASRGVCNSAQPVRYAT